jgi:hypothetical protein
VKRAEADAAKAAAKKAKLGVAAPGVEEAIVAARITPAAVSKMTLQADGYGFFSKFENHILTTQQRATAGSAQSARIDTASRTGNMGNLLDGTVYKYLNDPTGNAKDFADAPVITGRNERRRKINFHRAVEWCKKKGVPLVLWKKHIDPSQMTNEFISHMYQDPSSDVYEHFALDAPAMLLVNVVPHLRVSNGTSARMHSLTWTAQAGQDSVGAAMRDRIFRARPGQIIEVVPPDFVNVVIKTGVVIPALGEPLREITTATNEVEYEQLLPMKWWDMRAKSSKGFTKFPAHSSHAVDLGFAFTFYKVQGATLPRVILDLNFQSRIECTFAAVYVGISRVRNAEDLRLLPIIKPSVTTMIDDLRWGTQLAQWFRTCLPVPGACPRPQRSRTTI